MLDTKIPLIAEFLKDHQQFSRLLSEIDRLLAVEKYELARQRASELNALAGPHIAYEETELYPRLAALGEHNVSQQLLVEQHHDALDAVRLLISKHNLTPLQVKAIRSGIKLGLNHAEHCGSLISLMAQLSEEDQAKSLTQLYRLRYEGKLWTEL